MRTLVKKLTVSALAVLAALLLTLGFAFMRPVAFADTASTFKMEEGASVKYDATPDKNGIRFTATISKSEYETLTAGAASVESGTFIMPAAYQKAYGEINEESCFGAENTYYYKNADEENVGKDDARTQHEILNAVGVPRFVAEGSLYEVNGSIVKILDANLNLPLIARSYIKVTAADSSVTYHFAAMDADITKNVRSVVSVSQNALLKGVTGAELDTVKGYFDKFIELNPEVTANYVEKYSVVDFSGIKENADLTAERTAKLTAYNTTVESVIPAGYKKVVGYGAAGAVLKADGSTVLNTVIEKDNSARIIFDAENAAEFNATLVDNGIIADDKAASWSWDGTKSAYFSGDLARGFGWSYSEAAALPFATDAFALTVKSSIDFTMNIAVTGMASVSTVKTDGLATVEVKAGVNKIYFVLSQPMKTIERFYAYATGAIEGDFAIDDLSYENILSVNGSYGNLALEADATSFDITEFDSTVFGSENLIENVTVSYIEINDIADEAGEYTDVDKAADKYTIAVNAATSYIIKVKVTATDLEYEKSVYLIGDHGLLRESFEDGENSATFSNQYDAGTGKVNCSVTSDWSIDGSKSMEMDSKKGNVWWCGPKFDTALTTSGNCNYVSFWLFASSTAQNTGGFAVYFYTNNGRFSAVVPIETGIHKYTVKSTSTFNTITGIEISALTEYVAYMDLISANTDIVKEPFVRAEGAVMDFEAHNGGDHLGADNGYSLTCPVGSTAVSDEWSSDGDYSWKVIVTGDGWAQTMNSAPITVAEYNTIAFDININKAATDWEFNVYFDGGYKGGKADLQAGVNHVTFTFEDWSSTTFKGLECRANGVAYNYYYIDRVVLSKV